MIENKMDPEKNVVASLALHAVLEPVFKEVSETISLQISSVIYTHIIL